MKKLTTEEKAKAYDIAVKKIEMLLGSGSSCSREELEYVFPQLKESEYERVRKEILQELKESEDSIILSPFKRERWIAWLEEQREQKPFDYGMSAWTEDDENMMQYVIGSIDTNISDSNYENIKAWLKYLKDIVQPKQEWNKEDEKIRKSISSYFAKYMKSDMWDDDFSIGEIVAWLEKLGYKYGTGVQEVYGETLFKIATVLSQYEDKEDSPLEKIREIMVDGSLSAMDVEEKNKKIEEKSVWDEDDKENISMLIDLVESKEESMEVKIELSAWLKALKEKVLPKNTWKPTDEQMKLLREVQQALLGKDCHNRFVNFMYELKRLKEG